MCVDCHVQASHLTCNVERVLRRLLSFKNCSTRRMTLRSNEKIQCVRYVSIRRPLHSAAMRPLTRRSQFRPTPFSFLPTTTLSAIGRERWNI